MWGRPQHTGGVGCEQGALRALTGLRSAEVAVGTLRALCAGTDRPPGLERVLSASPGRSPGGLPAASGDLADTSPSALAVEGQTWEVVTQGQRPGKPRLPSELPSIGEGGEPE